MKASLFICLFYAAWSLVWFVLSSYGTGWLVQISGVIGAASFYTALLWVWEWVNEMTPAADLK